MEKTNKKQRLLDIIWSYPWKSGSFEREAICFFVARSSSVMSGKIYSFKSLADFSVKKWANPGLFFVSFRSFWTNITIFTTNICEKCPSSKWCRDSNSWPLECESLPITTRPGRKYWYIDMVVITFNKWEIITDEVGAVVVAQLVERLLLMPEVRGLNPVIGKLLFWTFTCLLSTVLKRRK